MALFGFGKGKPPAKPAWKPRPTRLIPLREDEKRRLSGLLCDGVIAENLGSFEALCETYEDLQAEHSDRRVLVTLDNPYQALYTSGHATNKHHLDDTEGHDLSGLPPECFEDGKHLGYLTTEAELPITLANLKGLSANTSFDDACGLLPWNGGDPEAPKTPDALIKSPGEALGPELSREFYFQFVPVNDAADALAALPNGYFAGDLSPMQSYAVAKHLDAHHGFKLFGVGASNLGFVRSAALNVDEAAALAEDIARLHVEAPSDATERLTAALEGKRWVLLRYSEW